MRDHTAEFDSALAKARAKGPNKALQAVFDRMDREAPIAVKNQLKGWGLEACRLFMTDEGFRQRRLRALGLDKHGNDHETIARILKGHIYGDYLARRRAPPWAPQSPHNRWVLCGFRLAELRMARAARRRRSLKIVKES
jgi:hypothetical protein